jgi:hypothetical protein
MYKQHCGIDGPQLFRKRIRNRRELDLGFQSFIWCEHVSTVVDKCYKNLGRDNPSPLQALLFTRHRHSSVPAPKIHHFVNVFFCNASPIMQDMTITEKY